MRLQYIHDGAVDCPLILFAGRDADTVVAIREALRGQSDGQPLSLHAVPGVEAVDGIRITASLGEADLGVRCAGDRTFSWVMDSEGREQVIELLAPFSQRLGGSAFQYLSREGPIAVVISTDGNW
jgi:hypothetical protein